MLAEPPFSLLQNLSDVDDAIDCNAEIADAIFRCGIDAFSLDEKPQPGHPEDWQGCARASDVEKAHSTIRQFYRDWSVEGMHERKSCYDYVLDQLRAFFQTGSSSISPEQSTGPKVLVPGAGLGRLAYEICRAGFNVEGNEISYHQLLASSWVLNHAATSPYALYPFATQFTNLRSRKQQLRKVMVPDIHPGQEMNKAYANGESVGQMNMTAGDFVVVYGSKEYMAQFNAVVTVFFIDTAPNFIRYIDAVSNCLTANGIWINIGPLLWHSDVTYGAKPEERDGDELQAQNHDRDMGIGEPGSFELTEEEVIWLLEKKGFQVQQRDVTLGAVGYIQDPNSMFQNLYRVSSWVAKKIN